MEDYTPTRPCSGDVYAIGRAASVQFTQNPILFRVIRVETKDTYVGWVWLDGYEINTAGDAVERRSIFVQLAGLRLVSVPGRMQSSRPVTPDRNQRQLPARPNNRAPAPRGTSTRA